MLWNRVLETESFVMRILRLGFWRNTDLGYWVETYPRLNWRGISWRNPFNTHFPTWVLEILTLVYWVGFKPRLNWKEFFTEGAWQYVSSDLGFGDTEFRLLGWTSEVELKGELLFLEVFLLSKFTCVSVILLGSSKFGWIGSTVCSWLHASPHCPFSMLISLFFVSWFYRGFLYLFSSTNWVNNRYKRNGLLQMLKRNVSVKEAPQRWQDNAADGAFDVVFTFEERVFDMVIEGLLTLYYLVVCLFAWFQQVNP